MNLMGSFPSFVEGELESHRGNKIYVFKRQSVQREEKSVHTHITAGETKRPMKEAVENSQDTTCYVFHKMGRLKVLSSKCMCFPLQRTKVLPSREINSFITHLSDSRTGGLCPETVGNNLNIFGSLKSGTGNVH